MNDVLKSNQIAYTKLNDRIISTVKLPFAHGIYMYETMMYHPVSGEFDDYQQRYINEDDALLGHIDAVAFIIGYEEKVDNGL